MHIKHIHDALEKLSEYACMEASKDMKCIDTAELGAVVDMVKDLCQAEKDAREAKILEKDEEEEKEADKYILMLFKSQYGDDEGKRYYDDWRYKSSGRFAPKGKGSYEPRRGYEEPPYWHMPPEYRMNVDDFKGMTAEKMRDMDKQTKGVMYYTEPIRNDRDMDNSDRSDRRINESRYDKARRSYTESREMHKDGTPESKQANMKELEKYMRSLSDDLTEAIEGASNEERTMLKQKLQVLLQKI